MDTDSEIAIVGGFAGGLSSSRDQEPATITSDKAVVAALVPPLYAAVYGITAANVGLFLGALHEFGTDVVFIALAAEVVLLLPRTPWGI